MQYNKKDNFFKIIIRKDVLIKYFQDEEEFTNQLKYQKCKVDKFFIIRKEE